ncbi:hypothetical protein PHPALM_28409 [Phytophthora palmivora]|uniref:Uncharacterized protein n=1 Tax=Phytophthora palmivora TaxID=4796 RepID=A0A2P4XA64_9STRA|nr:hypothetical protein PHPALM_28409 [Phytophthora palmivora]
METIATQLDRGEVKRRLIDVCRELTALVSGSYGPLGRAQLLQANVQCPDALTLTSVAERYFEKLNVGDCPIANAYFHILKSKIRNHADAGLFLAGLSARGLQLALDWIFEYLESPSCPVRVTVNWSSVTSISAVIRGIVSTKPTTGLNEGAMDTVVIPLIVQAFVSVFGYVVEHPSEPVPVQLVFIPGHKSIAKSEVWKQTVLLDLPSRNLSVKRSQLSPIFNVRVALFNITIEPLAEFEEEDSNSSTGINHAGSLSAFRLEALRQVGNRLEQLGATAVLSQKIIPNYLQTYLATKGIFTLDRLSATYIRGVQMLSGATILSDWRIDDSIISSSLGFLSLIMTQNLGSKQFIRLHRENPTNQTSIAANGDAHPVTTIAITAPDRFAYDELCHVITTSFKTLAGLIDNPDVVAGAGCLEIHLAGLLRARSNELRIPAPQDIMIDNQAARTLRQLSETVTTIADCLENLAGRLCGCHATATDRAAMIKMMYDANSDDEEKTIIDARILDVIQSKKDALVLAVESVSSLARISSVVRVS